NEQVRFVIQAPGRTIGVVPPGGNVVDAALIDAGGAQLTPDHFGELSLLYKLGRTCDHQRLEIVRAGGGGGAAGGAARGRTIANDYINLKGVPAIPIDNIADPDVDDGLDCATTYVLAPGATTLQVYWTLYNGSKDRARGPMGALADTGGSVDVWGA